MKSVIPGEKEMQKQWHVVDAEGQILGRLATRVARLLTGKEKPVYTPFLDTGDHVIVINADKVRLTGKKLTGKMYRHHTGYPGGLREVSAGVLMARTPERLVREAVFGMLPKTKLGRAMRKKLRVYSGSQHPHQAQRPVALAL
ncbi:MAG: ribosomal protein bacterial type [Acidobacteria bacterium]|jgi:large subunit ribosomal protein L13|nr:ribosomal protein bacterial type [Acidobacteriota bacterium]